MTDPRTKSCARCGKTVQIKRGGAEPHSCPHWVFCETSRKKTLACAKCERARASKTKKEKDDAAPRV